MRTFLFIVLGLLAQVQAFAHDPNLASYRVYPENGRWLLRIDLATSSLNFMPEGFNAASADFKDEFASYLRQNISFVLDGNSPVELGTGGIKSGSHAIEAIFFLNNFSPDWMTLDAEITCFAANEHQRHLLRVSGPGTSSKALLDASNDFSIHFEQVRVEAD
jgi:hypothetical protein